MNNIQKAFKNKAKRGLCMAIGGITPVTGNNLTRSNEMGAAAAEMERTRLAGEADFRKRMSTPPAAIARGPLDGQVAMGEAMASLSNTDRYKLGGSGTSAEASEIGQRNDIMKRLNAALPSVTQEQDQLASRRARPGLLGGQDDLFGMNLAGGGMLPPKQTSFGDRPMPPSTPLLYDNAPARPIPPRAPALAKPVGGLPNGANRYMPAPEYPQERVRPAAPAAPAPAPVGTYPGVTGVVDLIRNRKVANATAMDYADGGFISAVNDKLRTVKQGLSSLIRSDESSTTRKTPPPARYSATEVLTPAEGPDMPKRRTQSFVDEVSRRKKQMEEAMNYAAGGIVRGKGGPTDDEVPMSVGGTPVNLSPREAVLPVKTVMSLGGPEAVEDLIERTNGKPPVRAGLRAGGNYAAGAGGKEDPEELMQRISRKYGVAVPPAAPVVEPPAPVAAPVRPDIRGAQQGAYKAMLGTVAKPFAHAIDAGLNLAANAAGYDRPDTQAFVKPVNDYVDEGLRQVAPIVSTAGVTSQSIPDALGWKKRPDVPGSAPTTAVPVGQPQAPTAAVPVGQPQAPTTAADIQDRSMAAEGLRGFAQRRMNLPPTQQQDVVNGGSLVQRGNVGLRAIGSDQGTMNALNEAHGQQGTGVTYSTVKGADGKPQVMISGGPATKAQYIAADGTPTNDWTQTAQYAESKGLHSRNKQALRDIEMENARGDMVSALPFYQGRGLRTMAGRLREDEIAQKGQLTPAQREQIAIQREGLGLQRDTLDATIANRDADNARATKSGEQEAQRKFRDEVDNELIAESGRGGKDSAPIYAAQLKAYRANYEAGRKDIGKDPRNWAQEVAKQYRMEQLLNMKGQHYAVPGEREWDGETKTEWIYDPSSRFSDTFTDLTGKHRFRNKQTGQSIDLDHIRRLPPDMQRVFLKERVLDSKGENNIDMTRLLENAK